MKNKTDTTGREQKISVQLDAPLKLVWEVWTNPDHIKHWWGPKGFTNRIDKMECKNGGEWSFIMHGPDGKDYPNKSKFQEVVRHKKIVFEHFDPNFVSIISFAKEGNRTILHWYKLYETKELFETVEITYKANDGLLQTIEKLKSYLLQLSQNSN